MINSVADRKAVASIVATVWLALGGQGISYGLSPVGEGSIYWTDLDKGIFRSDLDGSNVEHLVKPELRYPGNIELDVLGGKMYWTDRGGGDIYWSDLDGSNLAILVDVWGTAIDLALDIAGGKIYWTDSFNADDYYQGALMRANIDGSNIELLTEDVVNRNPGTIALDLVGGKVYWIDRGNIHRADLDGTNVEHLFDPLARAPHRLALDASKMYWTDLVKGTIQRSDLNGSNIEVLITGLDHPRGIVLSGKNKIYWVDSGTREFLDNRETGKIQAANLDGTNVEDIVTGLSYPDDIVLDAVRGTIYWTTLWDHVIRRADLDGSNIEEVLTGLGGIPRGITLDLAGDKIYWVLLVQPPFYPPSEYSDYEQMFRSNLDGSNIEEVGEWGTGGIGIALDIPHPTSILTPDSLPEIPATSGLLPNYPNPFNASTQIAYRLATPGLVRLAIYNVLGQPVRILVNQVHSAGSYQASWDARDQQGDAVATGVYFTRLHYSGGVETRRLLYLR